MSAVPVLGGVVLLLVLLGTGAIVTMAKILYQWNVGIPRALAVAVFPPLYLVLTVWVISHLPAGFLDKLVSVRIFGLAQLAILFVLNSAVLYGMIRGPDDERLTVGKACVLSIIQVGIQQFVCGIIVLFALLWGLANMH